MGIEKVLIFFLIYTKVRRIKLNVKASHYCNKRQEIQYWIVTCQKHSANYMITTNPQKNP